MRIKPLTAEEQAQLIYAQKMVSIDLCSRPLQSQNLHSMWHSPTTQITADRKKTTQEVGEEKIEPGLKK